MSWHYLQGQEAKLTTINWLELMRALLAEAAAARTVPLDATCGKCMWMKDKLASRPQLDETQCGVDPRTTRRRPFDPACSRWERKP